MSEKTPLPKSTRIIYSVFDFFFYRRKRFLALLAAVVVLGVAATGIQVIKKEERGVLTQFGRVVNAEVAPGIRYRIPFIQKFYVRKVKRVVTHQVSSMENGAANFTLLSGDMNLVEVDFSVQYKIKNLENYLFRNSDPVMTMTMLLRKELVEVFSRNFIDLIFTSNRDLVHETLLNGLIEGLEAIDSGIEVVSLNIVDVRPVEEAVFAFRDVNDAIAERLKTISNANTRKEHLLAHSNGQADALIMSAKANAHERIVTAKSSANVFRELLAEYRKAPKHVAVTRYWERMNTIFADASLSVLQLDKDATIDINMIEDRQGFAPLPVEVLTGQPSSGPAPDGDRRPLMSTAIPDLHRLESAEADKATVSGQYHKSRTERDHILSVGPRSLIFDLPSFSHSHLEQKISSVVSGTIQKQLSSVPGEKESEKKENKEGLDGKAGQNEKESVGKEHENKGKKE